MNLQDKVAIITGGSKGIGKAIAIELAKQGAHPVLVSRGEEALKSATAEIAALPEAKEQSVRPMYVAADVSSSEEVARIVGTVQREYGRVDVLVNNAGVYRLARIKEVSADALEKMLDINLKGAVLLTREVLPIFAQQGHGAIVDIGSTAALDILDQNNAYAPSKHGHRVWSSIVALEHPEVKVYRIHPSNTQTEGRKEVRSELEREIQTSEQFLPANEIGVEVVHALAGKYGNAQDIVVRAGKSGEKIVEAATVKLDVTYTKLN